jgi:hypothetical protein
MTVIVKSPDFVTQVMITERTVAVFAPEVCPASAISNKPESDHILAFAPAIRTGNIIALEPF